MDDYPKYWLCKNCKRSFSKHVKIGTPNEQYNAKGPATENWCFSGSGLKRNIIEERSWKFTPVDNLTLIEEIAKKKEKGIK